MKRKLLVIFVIMFNTCLQLTSCHVSTYEKINDCNNTINDTLTLNDGHLYYTIYTYGSNKLPIHSQYCKNHK